jgi:hypothetical protein
MITRRKRRRVEGRPTDLSGTHHSSRKNQELFLEKPKRRVETQGYISDQKTMMVGIAWCGSSAVILGIFMDVNASMGLLGACPI